MPTEPDQEKIYYLVLYTEGNRIEGPFTVAEAFNRQRELTRAEPYIGLRIVTERGMEDYRRE